MRLGNTGNCLHRVSQHVGHKTSQQVAVGPKPHVYRYGIIHNVRVKAVVSQINRKRLPYASEKLHHINGLDLRLRQVRQLIVRIQETAYALAFVRNQRHGFVQILALVTVGIALHVRAQRHYRGDGVAHLMCHDAQDAVVIQFARLKLHPARAVDGHNAPHGIRHAVDVRVVTLRESDGGIVHVKRIHEIGHGPYQPPHQQPQQNDGDNGGYKRHNA